MHGVQGREHTPSLALSRFRGHFRPHISPSPLPSLFLQEPPLYLSFSCSISGKGFLKECEWRFNHRHDDLYLELLRLLRQYPL